MKLSAETEAIVAKDTDLFSGCGMDNRLPLQTLLRSCAVLFGPELDISKDFLKYLQLPGLKKAYRHRARETHPDLAAGCGNAACTKERLRAFLDVRESYENLKKYLQYRGDDLSPQPHSPSRGRVFATDRPGDGAGAGLFRAAPVCTGGDAPEHDLHESGGAWNDGNFPRRRLMLGDFLYFARVAQWQDIIHALVWQRASRPRLGDLGCSLGWLRREDISIIFRSSRYWPGQRFGEVAVQLGLLDGMKRDRLVFYQQCRQQKIGQYFVERGFLTAEELPFYINMLKRHNALYLPSVG